MSKVALRVYNREIETLIDQGHIDETIAHCQHILKLYPKHLETYRLLGKAYLEGRRYPDAADIFQRVLMTVPDDFISQLGMSIVCDEQKDLDGAIWHMERAFEVNPSNSGVQGELRRLYGRRDGLEPPKIRLTRGALAQMYTKGGQYQQAIAEIKSVLAEDPTRIEMRVLLARAFYRGGQKVEATELCIELLKQFPYCLDANRILVEVLPGTSLAQNLDTYKKRVQALDPYAALATGSIFEVESVPDNAVTLERLEWEPGAGAQEYSSPAQSGQSGEAAIPDFLRTSGWGPSTGEFKEGPVDYGSEEPAAAAPADIAAAQIPDWLKAMAPPDSSAPSAEQDAPAPAGQGLASEDLDWLAGLGGPVAGGAQPGVESQPEAAEPAASADQPDWLKDLGGPVAEDLPSMESRPPAVEAAPAGEQPDWLKDLGGAAGGDLSSVESQPQATEPASTGDTPDWLKDLGGDQGQAASQPAATLPETTSAQPEAAQPAASDELDWLKNLGGAADVAAPQAESLPIPRPEANVKKDLSGDDEDIPPMTAPVSGPGTSESEQDDAMKWLESLAQKQGAKAEELITNPNDRTEHAPDWVAKVDEAPAAPKQAEAPAKFVPEKPVEIDDDAPPGELSPVISGGPGTTASEQDDAMKWLESLAEKQGAKAEELITDPGERTEHAPGWVGQVENPPTPLSAPASGPGTTAPEQDDAMKWLEGLAENQGAKAEELITNPAERSDDAPAWVTQGSVEATSAPQAAEPAAGEQDDTMAWLQGLASGGTPAETPPDQAPIDEAVSLERAEAPAQPVEPVPWEPEAPSAESPQPTSDVSEWLKNLEVQEHAQPGQPAPEAAAAAEPQQASVPAEEIPDWLNSMRDPAEPGQAPQEDLPDWLKDQSADEQPPASVTAPAWVPAEEAPSPALGVMEPPPAEPPIVDSVMPPAVEPIPAAPAAQEPAPVVVTPSTPVPPATPARPPIRETGLLSDKDGPALQKARDLMAHGGLDAAVSEYSKLVKRGKLLEEVIYDLKEATYSHPVDVVVWQALGDAHMRANQLQEALDAYSKAEELLR